MRRIIIGIAAGALAIAGSSATAGDRQDQLEQLQRMQQQLERLESRAEAAEDELAAVNDRAEQQQELIQSSGLADARGSSSGLASFLETLEVGGWLAASYNYNFNGLDGDQLGGGNTGGGGYPFHPDDNNFQVDQLWFELEKPVSEDSRGGFRADLFFGKAADLLADGSEDGLSGSEQDLDLYQAYVQYLAPIGNGVKVKAGKFATTIGAEVIQAPYNFNITRGQVYNVLQPITHTGVMASMEANGASMSLGVSNDTVSFIDIDNNNSKSLLWHMGYAEDTWGASFNGLWGSPFGTGSRSDKETILDLILNFDPTEDFSGYVNATWRTVQNAYTDGATPSFGNCGGAASCRNGTAWGVAAAGRYAIDDRTGIALRAEYVEDEDSVFSALAGGTQTPGDHSDLITVTGTVDHMLTEKLMLRAEARWDTVNVDGPAANSDDVFTNDGSLKDDQIVGAVEVIYNF